MKNYKLISVLLSALLISACTSEPSDDLQDSIVEATPDTVGALVPSALFDPSNSIIPFPNNLLFNGSIDGTINIPVANSSDLSDPQVALNGVDGFSTVAPMSSEFSTAIDTATVNGTSVKVYQVALSGPGGAVVGVISQLTFGVDFVAALSSVDSSQSTVAILPLVPLAEKTSYMVVITDDLMSTGGKPFGPSITYQLIKNLPDPLVFGDPGLPGILQSLDAAELAAFEELRLLVNISEATVAAFDGAIEVTDIIQGWSFTTQSIGDVLTQVRNDIRGGAVPVTSVALAPGPLGTSPGGLADIYIGTLQAPYYLTVAGGVNDPTPLGSFWRGTGGTNLSYLTVNLSPEATNPTLAIPLMVSVPIAGQPGTFPIVIYQHGITTNRATMLAIADAFAARGIAVAAIDLPMHGLTGNEANGTEFYKSGGNERTFELDLVTQNPMTGDITAEVPDGIIDTSGRHFINLANLQNTRDNLRQGVSDLFALTYAINNLTAGVNGFDPANIDFLGHSLGAMVGTVFTALEDEVDDAVLAMGGGSLPKILDGSASFSPAIVAGLAARGVAKGTPDYESFIGAAQTVVDSGDPVNYATDLAAAGEGILFFEVVGGNTSPSDLVVPNTVPDGNDSSGTVPAPLAGTEPILALMGLTHLNASTMGTNAQITTKFISGDHGSLLDPSADPLVFAEMQNEMAEFINSNGDDLVVADPSVLLVP